MHTDDVNVKVKVAGPIENNLEELFLSTYSCTITDDKNSQIDLKKRLYFVCLSLMAASTGIVSFSIFALCAVSSSGTVHNVRSSVSENVEESYVLISDVTIGGLGNDANLSRPLSRHCEERYIKQPLNHFGGAATPNMANGTLLHRVEIGAGYYQQRYFICDKWWENRKDMVKDMMPIIDQNEEDRGLKQHESARSAWFEASTPSLATCGPIFFYLGNEADVELYLNHTGFMWERGPEVGALLIFAEHRYFGKSLPSRFKERMEYLSSEQALADYATLINHLKKENQCSESTKVIGFGGSYGGMLASWFRMKYPHIVDGVLAASAPILAFEGQTPPVDPSSYAAVITYDASAEAGSSEQCIDNVRSSWEILFRVGQTAKGRNQLQKVFHLCHPLNTTTDVHSLAQWIQDGFGNMAMGNYPYPSSYLTMGVTNLPAYPVRVACSYLAGKALHPIEMLGGLRDAAGVYYNSSKSEKCYDPSPANDEYAKDIHYWDYLYCTEMCMPFSTNGVSDMFWKADHNWTSVSRDCELEWGAGVRPRLDWAHIVYGGRKALKTASNIIFSNGKFDPWSSFGISEDDLQINDAEQREIHVIDIAEGAHHLDLFFSHPLDPISVTKARNKEFEIIQNWLAKQ